MHPLAGATVIFRYGPPIPRIIIMKFHLKSFALLAAFATALAVGVQAKPVAVGSPAPDFTVTDINGKTQRLSDYKGKTVVLEWVNPKCPFVKKHYESGNIPNLQKSATGSGVVWLEINSAAPGKDGDFDAAQASAWLNEMHASPTAYIRDSDGTLGKLYGAKSTPHMFVITGDGTLAYDGAIDSISSSKKDDISRATNYVSAALTSVKLGQPVAKAVSEPYGCPVKY